MASSGEPTTRGARGEERRRQILEAAEQVFARASYWSATTEQVARVVGVSQPAIYRYFPSKKALFLETLGFRQSEIIERYTGVLASAIPAIDKIRHIARDMITMVQENPNIGLLRLQAAAAIEDPDIRKAVRGTTKLLLDTHEALFRTAIEEGDVRSDVDPRAAAHGLAALALFYYLELGIELWPATEPDAAGEVVERHIAALQVRLT